MELRKTISRGTSTNALCYFIILITIYFGWCSYILYQENLLLQDRIKIIIVQRDNALESYKKATNSKSCDKCLNQLHTLQSERDTLYDKLNQVKEEKDILLEECYQVISESSYSFSFQKELLVLKPWISKKVNWIVLQPYEYLINGLEIYRIQEYFSTIDTIDISYMNNISKYVIQTCLTPIRWLRELVTSSSLWSIALMIETASVIVQLILSMIQSVFQLFLDALFWALYSIFRLGIILFVAKLMGITKKYSSTSTIRTSFLGYFIFCEVSGLVKWLTGIKALDTPYFNWPQPGGLVGVDDITWMPSWHHQEYTFFTWSSQLVVGGLVAMIFGYLPGMVADKLIAKGLDKSYCISFVVMSWLLLLFECAAIVSWLSGLPIGQMSLINWGSHVEYF